MIINGIECKRIKTYEGKLSVNNKLYGSIPLEWLHTLPPKSGATKVVILLWAYGAMLGREWFSVSNKIFEEYGVSATRKNTILLSLERAGKVELKRNSGKPYQIKLIRPRGQK